LNEIVTADTCPEWLTLDGPRLSDRIVNPLSGTNSPREERI